MTIVRLSLTAALAATGMLLAQQFARATIDAAQCVYGLTAGLAVGVVAVLLQDAAQRMLRRVRRADHVAARPRLGRTSSQ